MAQVRGWGGDARVDEPNPGRGDILPGPASPQVAAQEEVGVRPANHSRQDSGSRPSATLAVEPQEVIPGQAEAADGWFGADTGMRAMPVVAVEPSRQFGGALT
jgi:hypothetical protein